MKKSSGFFLRSLMVASAIAALCAPTAYSQAVSSVPITVPTSTPQPPRVMTPPPMTTPPPTTPPPRIPVFPVMQPTVPRTNMPVINQIDLVPGIGTAPMDVENANALAGIKVVDEFPKDPSRDSMDQVLVRGTEGSKFKKVNSYTVHFEDGEILVSVRRPTSVAFVTFGDRKLALSPDADVMLKRTGDVYRIINLDGRGENVKIKLNGSEGGSQSAKVIALAPGYELVVSNRVLKHLDIRIADGCARRHFKILEDGKVSVCEIRIESVLHASAVIGALTTMESDKTRRILGDMSKMAAVLNYVNGTEGYTTVPAPHSVANK